MTLPKISIITVVYNAKEELEKTLENMTALKYDKKEIIVIDGGSTDGTKEVIEKYSLDISTWLSEPDEGLYDAMNKGLKLATGSYVWFINAGDFVYSPDTLSNIFMGQEQYSDIYYGETLILSEEGEPLGLRKKRLPRRLSARSFKNGMVVCHQSIIIRAKIAPLYNLDYKYAADIEWVIKSLKSAKTITNTHQILSKFSEGGISTRQRKKSLKERYKIMRKYFGTASTIVSHIKFGFEIFKPKYRKAPKYLTN